MIDFEQELPKEAYSSKEYITGRHDGIWEMIGLVQRHKALGCSLDEILEIMFQYADTCAKKYEARTTTTNEGDLP